MVKKRNVRALFPIMFSLTPATGFVDGMILISGLSWSRKSSPSGCRCGFGAPAGTRARCGTTRAASTQTGTNRRHAAKTIPIIFMVSKSWLGRHCSVVENESQGRVSASTTDHFPVALKIAIRRTMQFNPPTHSGGNKYEPLLAGCLCVFKRRHYSPRDLRFRWHRPQQVA